MDEPDIASLRGYLAERDVACPGCGYNLRGVQEPVCPECGGAVELSVGGAQRGRGYLVFLLVVLAWVAVSAGMNAARDARAAVEQSRVFAGQTLMFSGGMSISLGTGTTSRPVVISGTTLRPSGPITVNGTGTTTRSFSVSGTPSVSGRPAVNGTPVRSTSPLVLGGGRVSRPMTVAAATPTRTWAQVGWPTWLGLGWWGSLAVCALVGLIIVVCRRRRLVHEGPGPALLYGALGLAALHVAFQVFVFVRELSA